MGAAVFGSSIGVAARWAISAIIVLAAGEVVLLPFTVVPADIVVPDPCRNGACDA